MTLPSVDDGFSCPRLNANGSSGGFSSPKPAPLDPTGVIYKSNNSGKIKLRFEEIRQDLDHIWWDSRRSKLISARSRPYLVKSGEIQGDPSWFPWELNHIWWDLARFEEIQAYFGDFRSKCIEFLKIPVTFVESDDSLNRPNTTQTRNWLDQLMLAVGFESLRHPPNADRLGLG